MEKNPFNPFFGGMWMAGLSDIKTAVLEKP